MCETLFLYFFHSPALRPDASKKTKTGVEEAQNMDKERWGVITELVEA
jgi:hypothetical protein